MAVVAVALFDGDGRVLLQERPSGKHHAGLWEFPGGKVEIEENPRLALCREVAEELSIHIAPDDLTPALLADEGAAGPVVMMLYTSDRWSGEPVAREAQRWEWFSLEQAGTLPMPPMDARLLAQLGRAPIAKL